MRNDLAVFLAAALSSGATWWLTRAERPVDPVSGPEPTGPATSPEAPASGGGPVLRGTSPVEWAPLLAELRAIRARLEATPVASTQPGTGSPAGSRSAGSVLDHVAAEDAPFEALTADLQAVRKTAERRLLAVPDRLRTAYAGLLAQPDTGIGRILSRGKFEELLSTRGGGAYWSFATRSNSYDESPDVELQKGSFSSGFYGSSIGFVTDLGTLPLERVPDGPGILPPPLDESQRGIWEFLWSERGEGTGGYAADFPERAHALGVPRRATAIVGHTYVLRAILPGEHDLLVAFTSVEGDENGHTLVHRVLRTYPMTSRR